MERHELIELHYLTPISNLTSIMANGILSHNNAVGLNHESLADEDIQNRRQNVCQAGSRYTIT